MITMIIMILIWTLSTSKGETKWCCWWKDFHVISLVTSSFTSLYLSIGISHFDSQLIRCSHDIFQVIYRWLSLKMTMDTSLIVSYRFPSFLIFILIHFIFIISPPIVFSSFLFTIPLLLLLPNHQLVVSKNCSSDIYFYPKSKPVNCYYHHYALFSASTSSSTTITKWKNNIIIIIT